MSYNTTVVIIGSLFIAILSVFKMIELLRGLPSIIRSEMELTTKNESERSE